MSNTWRWRPTASCEAHRFPDGRDLVASPRAPSGGIMSLSAPAIVASRKLEMSREEWEARVQLAACYRIFDLLGWTEMIFNHITLRVPGPDRHFLLNPYGLWYREVTASNLVKIDLDGNQIGPSDGSVTGAGFAIHSAIHAAREDAHCIMHTHTTAGLAIACQRDGLLS